MQEEIKKTIEVLRSGGIILYPTDTVWGIGCDATNKKAVKRIFEIKKRVDTKAMLVLIDNPAKLQAYVEEIPDMAWDLIELTEKPLTIIYPEAKNLAENVIASDGSIAIRIPDDTFCHQLIKSFGKPIISTSANFSGEPSAISYANISINLLSQMDYVVQLSQNKIIKSKPSRIVKLNSDGSFIVIRE